MIGYVYSFLIIILEMLCCKIFYEIFGEKRREKIICECLLFTMLVIISFFSALIFRNSLIIKILMSVLEISIIMYIFFKITFVKSVILALLYIGLLFVVDYFCFLLSRTIFSNITGIDDMNCLPGILLLILGKTILFVMIIIAKKGGGIYAKTSLADYEWMKFIFFPIFTICITSAMILILGKPQMYNKDIIYFVISFGMAVMNIFVFYLINGILKKEEKIHKNSLLQLQIKNQAQMYYSISENLEKQRQKTHEYKNKIVCIESLLQKKKYDELDEYIGNVSKSLQKEMYTITTNHIIVDAILNTKYNEMVEKDIIFVFRINDLSRIVLADEDIIVILSNLLNNAIEACEQCQKRKIVKLKFINEEDALIISVKNTYENALTVKDGIYMTTKRDKNEHGIGIHNIINVIKKYNGSYVIRPDENEFFFSIIIPN